jgi:hypothetical protein
MELLNNVFQIPIEIPNYRTHEARMVIRNWGSNTCVQFNPKKQPKDGQSLWVVQSRVTHELQWDLVEWLGKGKGKWAHKSFSTTLRKKDFKLQLKINSNL